MHVFQVTWGSNPSYRELQKLSAATLRLALGLGPGEYAHCHSEEPAIYNKLLVGLLSDRALVVDVDLVALRPWERSDFDIAPGEPVAGVKARFFEKIARFHAGPHQLARFINGGLLSYGAKHASVMLRAVTLGKAIESSWYEETALNLALGGDVVSLPPGYNVQGHQAYPGALSCHVNLVRDPERKLAACREAVRNFACDEFRSKLREDGLI